MDCQVEELQQCAVIHVAGDVDLQTAGQLENCVLSRVDAQPDCRLILNLAEVPYMSSMGLRVIMKAAKVSHAAGGRVDIAGASGVMLEILQISRFDRVLDLYPNVEAAIAANG